MNIRKLTNKDRTIAAELYVKTFSQEPWNEKNKVEDIVAHFQRLAQMNTEKSFILEKDQMMIGIALGFTRSWYKGNQYHLDTFCIDPAFQGRGYGKLFMNKIKNELVADEVHTIILDTDRDMPAEKFYQSTGFTKLADSVLYAIDF